MQHGVAKLARGERAKGPDCRANLLVFLAFRLVEPALSEIFYLAELGKDCAEDQRYEFMLVAPALPITGAVGSPANPLAIK